MAILDSHQLRIFWPTSKVPCISQVIAHLGGFCHASVDCVIVTSRGMVAMMKSTFLPCSPGCISLSRPHNQGLKVCLRFIALRKRKRNQIYWASTWSLTPSPSILAVSPA